MTGKTSIEWATAVWNPTTGCTRVSDGCDNCYAFALHDKRHALNRRVAVMWSVAEGIANPGRTPASLIAAARAAGVGPLWPAQYDIPFSTVQLLPDRLPDPLRRRKPERYFVDSMADLFHVDVPPAYLADVFAVMSLATWHTFLVLTKRPDRMRDYMRGSGPGSLRWLMSLPRTPEEARLGIGGRYQSVPSVWPPPNIWLGTSVEDQRSADERIPALVATPAAVRFLSCEPLLGPIDLGRWLLEGIRIRTDYGTGVEYDRVPSYAIDWAIVGGESGPRARPMDLRWARSLVGQCAGAGVPVFVKQLGADPWENTGAGTREVSGFNVTLRDRKGGDMSEWPEDLRVRQFPAGAV